jgi:hypothetical protein
LHLRLGLPSGTSLHRWIGPVPRLFCLVRNIVRSFKVNC